MLYASRVVGAIYTHLPRPVKCCCTAIYTVLSTVLLTLCFNCSISVTFHDQKDGSTKTVRVPLGGSLLEAAHSNDIDLEGKHVVLPIPVCYCVSRQLFLRPGCASVSSAPFKSSPDTLSAYADLYALTCNVHDMKVAT